MQKCKLCGDKTQSVFNIDFKAVPICEPCAEAVYLQQATWYVQYFRSERKVAKLNADLAAEKEGR